MEQQLRPVHEQMGDMSIRISALEAKARAIDPAANTSRVLGIPAPSHVAASKNSSNKGNQRAAAPHAFPPPQPIQEQRPPREVPVMYAGDGSGHYAPAMYQTGGYYYPPVEQGMPHGQYVPHAGGRGNQGYAGDVSGYPYPAPAFVPSTQQAPRAPGGQSRQPPYRAGEPYHPRQNY